MSAVNHKLLLLFCYQMSRLAKRDHGEQRQHVQTQCLCMHLLTKRLNFSATTAGKSIQEHFCLVLYYRLSEKFKVALKSYNSPNALDWDLILQVKLMVCNHGKDVPGPSSRSLGQNSTSSKHFFISHFQKKNIFVLRIKTSLSFLIHLNSKQTSRENHCIQSCIWEEKSHQGILEIFSSLPEIRNLMYFKGKTNISIITASPDLEEEGKHLFHTSLIFSTHLQQKWRKLIDAPLGFWNSKASSETVIILGVFHYSRN